MTERKFAAHTEVSCSFEVRIQMIPGDLMSRAKKEPSQGFADSPQLGQIMLVGNRQYVEQKGTF